MTKYTTYRLHPTAKRHINRFFVVITIISLAAVVYGLQAYYMNRQTGNDSKINSGGQTEAYSTQVRANHQSVRATVFWAGEDATSENRFITNRASAWVSDWVGSFGGVDAPEPRCGPTSASLPCGFTPRENTFYFALPFNDYTSDGKLQSDAVLERIPWYHIDGKPMTGQSLIKNHWIEVTFNDKKAYAQWQDVGPFSENDIEYVFGSQPPKAGVGLDLSPATADHLGIDGGAKVAWRFVDEPAVPAGPWRTIITRGGLDFE